MNGSSPLEAYPQKNQGNVEHLAYVVCACLCLKYLSEPVNFGARLFLSEIWARFLAFESNIGDLASILKVERRRFTAFKDEYEGKETALLVDRYKFMDLYPCSSIELKALGYKVSVFSSFFMTLNLM